MASESSFSRIDTAQLGAIASGMSEMVLSILADFQESFNKEFQTLTNLSTEALASDWQDFFHRVKGSGGTLGLTSLQAKSAIHEESSKENLVPTMKEQNEFTRLFRASCEEAQKFLEGLES